jgi:RNA polymerase sigma factor (sigma-70 family)
MGQMQRKISLEGLISIAQAASTDDTWAMNQIICRFKPLARRLARATGANSSLRDDLENAAYVALVTAVRRHNLKRIGFPAFAKTYMGGAVWREYGRWVPEQGLAEGEPAPIEPKPALEGVEEAVHERLAPWDRDDLARAISDLSSSQRHLVIRRYVEDAPLALIAAEAGTSSSAVSQRLSTVHRAVATAISA